MEGAVQQSGGYGPLAFKMVLGFGALVVTLLMLGWLLRAVF
jgi:hypothetical protein